MAVEILDVVLRVGLTLATAFLFAIVFSAYLRLKNRKMLLISVGFGVFLAHALITLPELINETYQVVLNENVHLLLHLIALTFILLGTLKD